MPQGTLQELSGISATVPNTKDEAWKYSDCRRLSQAQFTIIDAAQQDNGNSGFMPTIMPMFTPAIFIDGHAISTTDAAGSIADNKSDKVKSDKVNNFFLKLNSALVQTGVQLYIQAGEEKKYHLVQHTITVSSLNNLYHRIYLEAGACLTLLESITADAKGAFSNPVLHIELAAGATLRHYRVLHGEDANIISHTYVQQQQNSNYEAFIISTGARLARQNINVQLQAEDAHCNINALQWLANRQHSDLSVRIEHIATNCSSKQYYKNIAANRSRLACQASAIVKQGADGSDAQQFNGNLLLSEQAEIHGRPDLEIYADDVRCAHGLTCGQLDEQALFYLRTRGINATQARTMLLQAFTEDVLRKIPDKDNNMQIYMRQQLHQQLEMRGMLDMEGNK